MSEAKFRARVLALVPARAADPGEAAWTHRLLDALARRWPLAVIQDPGPPARVRGNSVFVLRSSRDFNEQLKEAIFEHPIDAVLAVGEAANAGNLQRAAGWAPLAPRAGLWLGSDWARAIADPQDRKASFNLCDVVLMAGEWRAGRRDNSSVEFVAEPEEAAAALEARFGLSRGPGAALGASGGRSVEVLRADSIGGSLVAWNRAIRRSRAARLLFLGPGARIARAGLARLQEYMDDDERLGAAGALRGQRPTRGGIERLQAAHSLLGRGHREHDRIVESACWLARREAFRRAGLFDERLPGYAAAAFDFSLRLRQGGFRVMTATDVLCWPGRASAGPGARELESLRRKWCEDTTSLLLRLAGRP